MSRDLKNLTGRDIRSLCRSGQFNGPTAGIAQGFTQVNLVILREKAAKDFERFCHLNPKPCPLLERTSPGQYEPVNMAPQADVRTDLPRYRVFRNGQCVDRTTSVTLYWREDCVAFLIGCSFTFEWAMMEAGLPVRHIEEGRNVPMYRTSLLCQPVGTFSAPLIVSMRPMTPKQAEQAARITESFSKVHGAPLHVGDPNAIGITNLSRPDYGDAVTVHPDEIPVFWACGVTPMEAVLNSDLDLAITHEPGHMLVTDVPHALLREPCPEDSSSV